MKHKLFKQAVPLMLIICTLFSTLTISFADGPTGSEGYGGGGGGGGGDSSGNFSVNNSGYRIYIFDPKTGKRVSNVIDFITSKDRYDDAGSKVRIDNTKLPDDSFSSGEYLILEQSFVKDTVTNGTKPGNWPLPMTHTSATGFVGNGKSVLSWFLNNTGHVGSYGSGSSGGGYNIGNNFKPGDINLPQKPSTGSGTTLADKIRQIQGIDWATEVAGYYNAGHYTKSNARTMAMGTKSMMMSSIMGTTSSQEEKDLIQAAWNTALANLDRILASYSWPNETQTSNFVSYRSRILKMTPGDQKAYNTIVADLSSSVRRSTLTSLQYQVLLDKAYQRFMATSVDAGPLNGLFTISYAETTGGGTAGSTTGNLFVILNAIDENGNYIFQFKSDSGITLENDPKSEERGESEAITYTAWKNGLRVGVEPVWWFRPQKNGSDGSFKYCFYGTPTNYGEWQDGQEKNGGWTDGGKGGHYTNAINKVGASCLILDEPEDDLNFPNGRIGYVAIPTSPLRHATLADKTKGYAMHWYTFSGANTSPSVPTYDPSIGDPPHPAPDPTTPDPGDGSYNVNIVKVYDYQHEDETIEHIETTLKQNEPGTIYIQHEPTYKVVAFFTSNTLIPGVSSSTTWEEANQAPVISGDNFSWSTVKSKTAGTTETTVYLSKAAASDDANTGATTLYVRLLRTDVSTPVDYGANVISESQLNKVIGTDKKFGGDTTQSATWGNYLFNMSLPTPDTYNLVLETDTVWY